MDPERARRRAMKKEWQAVRLAREEASVPVARRHLRALLDHLDATLFERRGDVAWCHCDHTTARTRAFLERLGLDTDAILAWCEEYGGFCDCEIAANVGSRWGDWTRDAT